ncbi:hypothetical protein HPB48_013890 [Haemaphysalis longicornis]|uniref:Uncharacterized protein n=1 Tax=Haemaphysalis longicornis TaxID=44386 RepID=A0A9J6G3R6_HAELO|nr:hypothetical protein HPB48_013890 [Haemaphysalis longicornis]
MSACPTEKVMTVCAQTQTVFERLSSGPVSVTRHEATQDDAGDKFRIMLNPDPNERFSVVRKERVFIRSGGSGQRVTWTSPILTSSEGKNRVPSCNAPASDLSYEAC